MDCNLKEKIFTEKECKTIHVEQKERSYSGFEESLIPYFARSIKFISVINV